MVKIDMACSNVKQKQGKDVNKLSCITKSFGKMLLRYVNREENFWNWLKVESRKKRRRRRRKNSSIIATQIDGRRDQVEESRGRKRWKRLVRKAAETGVTIDLRMTINPAALSVPKAPPSSPSEWFLEKPIREKIRGTVVKRPASYRRSVARRL